MIDKSHKTTIPMARNHGKESHMVFASFIGMLAAVCLDPIVIFAALISAFIGKTYQEFIAWSFGIGFLVSVGEVAAFGERPGAFMPMIAVPFLANFIYLIRSWCRQETQPEKELPPEDTEYFQANYGDKRKDNSEV